MSNPHIHTHYQVAQASAQTRTCQRVCLATADKKKMKIKHGHTIKPKNKPTGRYRLYLAKPLFTARRKKEMFANMEENRNTTYKKKIPLHIRCVTWINN